MTNLADSGPGTLRQAVADAESGDTITFATSGTITLNGGPLHITNDLTIAGPGPANLSVSGNNARRVFDVPLGATASISGLIIRDGRSDYGGGMLNAGTLVLSNCVITANGSTIGNSGSGGGIFNAGALTLIACTISHNLCGDGGPGANGQDGTSGALDGGNGGGGTGGGIYNAGTLTLIACTVANNAAGNGGHGGTGGQGILGLFLDDGNGGSGGVGGSGGSGGGILNIRTLVLSNCTMYGNSAGNGGHGGDGGSTGQLDCGHGGDGGQGGNSGNGGFGYNAVASGLTMTGCTVTANRCGAGGAGGTGGQADKGNIGNGANGGSGSSGHGGGIINYAGALTVNGCTLSINSAYQGGGFYGVSDTTTLNNCTLSGNSATSGGGIYDTSGTLFLTNTIVGGNSFDNLYFSGGGFGFANNLTSGDPLLAPLGNYGGPTLTMPPLHGSPAIDAGLDSVMNFLATDQRGYTRRSGAHVDIGAVEAQAVSVANAPVLKSAAIQGGAFSFSYTNLPGADFTVLGSTNLSQWEILGPATRDGVGQYYFSDPEAPNYPQRFYKVASP